MVNVIKQLILVVFFFQAEDGIRDLTVTGVQTCALPILVVRGGSTRRSFRGHRGLRLARIHPAMGPAENSERPSRQRLGSTPSLVLPLLAAIMAVADARRIEWAPPRGGRPWAPGRSRGGPASPRAPRGRPS